MPAARDAFVNVRFPYRKATCDHSLILQLGNAFNVADTVAHVIIVKKNKKKESMNWNKNINVINIFFIRVLY